MVLWGCRIHGVAIHGAKETFLAHIDRELQALGFEGPQASELVDITTDYIGDGVGKAEEEISE